MSDPNEDNNPGIVSSIASANDGERGIEDGNVPMDMEVDAGAMGQNEQYTTTSTSTSASTPLPRQVSESISNTERESTPTRNDSDEKDVNMCTDADGDADGGGNTNKTEKAESESIDPKIEVPRVLRLMETLRQAISEVIAFPTAANYARLYQKAATLHESFQSLGRQLEFGDNLKDQDACSNVANGGNEGSNNNAHLNLHLDAESRAKFNALGTSIWNMIQSHADCFLDHACRNSVAVASSSSETIGNRTGESASVSASTSTSASADTSTILSEEVQLEQHRGAASAYIRSIACRTILISKLQTKGLDIPQLVLNSSSTSTCSAGNDSTLSSPPSSSLPMALSSELEFALKCFTRAGRTLLFFSNHQSQTTTRTCSTTSQPSMIHNGQNNDDDTHDRIYSSTYTSSVAFELLSLAIVTWEGLKCFHVIENDDEDNNNGVISGEKRKRNELQVRKKYNSTLGHARSEAFDAMLLLPDCAAKAILPSTCKTATEIEQKKGQEEELQPTLSSAKRILFQLQRLDRFVKEQMDACDDASVASISLSPSTNIYIVQHYLPSLARIAYKHGNRFIRLEEYDISSQALKIALGATDTCLGIIRNQLHHLDSSSNHNERRDDGTGARNSSNISSSSHTLQIQEQEMLVVSKQILYALSLVCTRTQTSCVSVVHDTGMTGSCQNMDPYVEAQAYLDRIEVYIDEQRQRDDVLYSRTISQLSSSTNHVENSATAVPPSSIFALEGPKMQDISEMKSRAQAAKNRARFNESSERVNLAFARISLCQKSMNARSADYNNDEHSAGRKGAKLDEAFIDDQFNKMVGYTTKVISMDPETFDVLSLFATPKCSQQQEHITKSSKAEHMFRIVLASARSICSRRLLMTNEQVVGKCSDPYGPVMSMFPDKQIEQVFVRLEVLQTTFVAAKTARDKYIKDANKVQVALDKRTVVLGKDIISRLRATLSTHAKNQSSSERPGSTLFARPEQTNNGLDPLFGKAREYITRVLSMYQSLDDCPEQTEEWCDILIEVIQMLRQKQNNHGIVTISEDDCDKVVAGVMAIKASAQSSNGSYGAGLKTSRAAFDKDGTDIGNLVTLFRCSFHYESSSDIGINTSEIEIPYSNTLLELDNALATFISLSKLGNNSSFDKLLEAFPIMCKLALEEELLLLGLQKRWLRFIIKAITSKLSTLHSSHPPNDTDGEKSDSITLFEVLRPFLSLFEKILTSSFPNMPIRWQLDQNQDVLGIIKKSLELLILLRESRAKKSSISFDDDAQFIHEQKLITAKSLAKDEQSLFETTHAENFVGTQDECICIAEQLWNIAMQAMAIESTPTEKMTICCMVAEYFRSAHDFALLSEEEARGLLTKGHLACDGFDSETYASTTLDFSVTNKTMASDLCSEFSYQCLISSVANVIDAFNSQDHENDHNSIEAVQLLELSHKCLVVAMAELRTLELSQSRSTQRATIWLSLNILVAMRNDESAYLTLSNGGLLDKLEEEIGNSIDEKDSENSLEPLDHLYFLANRAETFGMRSAAKLLLILCANEMSRKGMNNIIDHVNTIGVVQRKIIHLASTVEEVVNTFDAIDSAMKPFVNEKDVGTNGSKPYTTNDIDYFVVEAHNRAVNLIFIGDISNAEKLLTVSLNLLPFGSKEVECYGTEIRHTYRGVIGRRGMGCGALTLSAGNLVTLFEG